MAVITCVPFLINATGTSIFIYLTIGNKDLVVAASEGVSHNAVADHFEFDEYDALLDPYLEAEPSLALQGKEYRLGPLRTWIEPNGSFRPHRFSITPDAEYFAFEFPWLLIPSVFAVLAFWRVRRSKRRLAL
ncbi:MAG: hypothetical protein AAGI37_01820 [Planctomycetota bacterium]